MGKLYLTIFMVICHGLFPAPLRAQEEAPPAASAISQDPPSKTKQLEIEGVIEVGGEATLTDRGETYQELKLKLKSPKRQQYRAYVRLEGESDENSVRMQEVFVRRYFQEDRLDFGLAKKRLGREYHLDEDLRPTIRRTLVYRRLEEFAYVGRELSLRLFREEAENGDKDFSLSLGYSESNDAHVIGHVRYPIGTSAWQLGTSLLMQLDRTDDAKQFAWLHVLSIDWQGEGQSFDTEAFLGLDPYNSHFESLYGSGRKVHFAAMKSLWAKKWNFAEGLAGELVMSASALLYDLKEPGFVSYSALTGWNQSFSNDFQLMLQVEAIANNSRLEHGRFTFNDSNLMLAAKYFF